MFMSYLLLLQIGDFKPNPGPKQVKAVTKSKEEVLQFPCLWCKVEVSWSEDALQCNQCDQWLHRECMNMSVGSYKRHGEALSVWLWCKYGNQNLNSPI